MSRNRERIGAQNTNIDAPTTTLQNNNGADTFSFVVPTEFVDLPSQGRYYSEDHPLHGEETLEIKHMTAREEDILTSRTLLKKGIALDRVLQNLIVDKTVNADSLLVGDRNALIIAARISGYGALYTTKVTCPACEISQEYSFDLNDAEMLYGDDVDSFEIENNNDGTFNIELPVTKVSITFKLLTGHDEKKLLAPLLPANRKKTKGLENNVTRQLSNIICAVNGDATPKAVNYLINNLPSMDSRHLRMAYRVATPNIDLTQEFECTACDFTQEMEVPLSADFFWPDR